MSMVKQIEKQQQLKYRSEQALYLEKLKKRRADTRNKIELGGLVIKSGMNAFNKAIILGALDHVLKLIEEDTNYITLFEGSGDSLFLKA